MPGAKLLFWPGRERRSPADRRGRLSLGHGRCCPGRLRVLRRPPGAYAPRSQPQPDLRPRNGDPEGPPPIPCRGTPEFRVPFSLEQLKAGVNPTAAFMRRCFGVGPAGIAPNKAMRGAQGPEEITCQPYHTCTSILSRALSRAPELAPTDCSYTLRARGLGTEEKVESRSSPGGRRVRGLRLGARGCARRGEVTQEPFGRVGVRGRTGRLHRVPEHDRTPSGGDSSTSEARRERSNTALRDPQAREGAGLPGAGEPLRLLAARQGLSRQARRRGRSQRAPGGGGGKSSLLSRSAHSRSASGRTLARRAAGARGPTDGRTGPRAACTPGGAGPGRRRPAPAFCALPRPVGADGCSRGSQPGGRGVDRRGPATPRGALPEPRGVPCRPSGRLGEPVEAPSPHRPLP
ncbi:unnamed protein product [Rangifer tarandus platyrhynchus]|uniref:Uncharacterized protein n=2 Tax=Rangifer tarandus platyrhynchus TaxID=3082113 RepID=A0ACB0DVV5_RANTA|nr:unnamed protein product [Rangifer tarandus platyrhynchus]CAI9692460.1 unnamed protein product [Rangifer tarandus platyrhynchus]